MKFFYFIIVILASFFNAAYADEVLTVQPYAQKMMPVITSIEDGKITLSDGSIWKKANESDDLSKKWSPQDRVIIRWDKQQSKYFLHDISKDSNLENRKEATFIDLQEPPHATVSALDEHTLILSDGTSFVHIPFISPLHVGEHVLISWNENKQGKYYPYIIVGYSLIENSNKESWEVDGEIQARLAD